MFADILKDKKFNIFFSAILGLFLAVLLRPSCENGRCKLWRTPPMHEIRTSVYKINDKCFRFHANEQPCPPKDVIEPFVR